MGLVIKREYELDDLEYILWSGAKDKWISATDEQRERVLTLLGEIFENTIPDLTTVNDVIWFECDNIFYDEVAE